MTNLSANAGKCLALLLVATPVASHDIDVDCSKGQSLQKAVKNARPGTIIRVSGTCVEHVTIGRDRIVVDGGGEAIVDGGGEQGKEQGMPAITVQSARNVRLLGLTVRNSGGHGVVVERGAVAELQDMVVTRNGEDGVMVRLNSSAKLNRVRAEQNNDDGLSVIQTSSATFHDKIETSKNGDAGIVIADASMVDMHEGKVDTHENKNSGIAAGDDAVLFTGAGPVSGTLHAYGNGGDGLFLFNAFSLEAAGGGDILADKNGVSGIHLVGNAVLSNPEGRGRVVLEDNPVGLLVDVQGGVFMNGGLTARRNGVGLLASGANTVTVNGRPDASATISGNSGLDVKLEFGTRSTFDNAVIGSIQCDKSVLSRGSVVCPN